MATVTREISDLKDRVLHLERVLILGDGDRLPLAEIVRNLTKTVDDYITQKRKEEDARKLQWDKLKWVIVSFAVPVVLVFLGQAFIFFFKIYPILESLTK